MYRILLNFRWNKKIVTNYKSSNYRTDFIWIHARVSREKILFELVKVRINCCRL